MAADDELSEFVSGKPNVAKMFGQSPMTIHRWMNDPRLDFPQPAVVHGRLIWKRDALRAWAMARVGQRIEQPAQLRGRQRRAAS
jgi:predicted DNA-binding transcriptional regulator AlpA